MSTASHCQWSKSMVNVDGQCQWSMPMVKVDGQCRWSLSMVKVVVNVDVKVVNTRTQFSISYGIGGMPFPRRRRIWLKPTPRSRNLPNPL